MPLDNAYELAITAKDLSGPEWSKFIANTKRAGAEISALNRPVQQLGPAFETFGAASNRAVGSLVGTIGGLVPLLSGAAVAQRVWAAGMKAADLGEQAEQIGLNTDQLQAYRLVAAQAGVENGQLDAAMTKLTRSMGEAGGGNDDLIAKFTKLGVKLLDSEGQLRKVSAVAPEVARGLLGIESETERNAMMMDLFGKSGMKMVTILGELARGNDALVDSAKAQNAVMTSETIKAWDVLADRMKVADQQLDAFLATIGAPIAVAGLEHVLQVFSSTRKEIEAIQKAWDWLTGSAPQTVVQAFEGGSSEDLIKRQETIKAHMDVLKDSTDELDVARLAGYRQELQRISDILASRAKVYVAPAATITAEKDKPGVSQPLGKQAGADGLAAANKALADSQQKLNELVNQSKAEYEAAQAILIKYGDSAAFVAAEQQKLADLAPFLEGKPQILAAAQQDIANRARDMDIAFRGAQGGAEGFFAGLEASMVSMERANSSFALGQAMVGNLSASFTEAALSGELNFSKIASSFANMLAQMAIQAAIHASLRMFLGAFGGGGMGSTGGGLLDGLFGMIFGSPFMAEGGPVSSGRSYIVGEKGPEIFVPDAAGTIVPNRALRHASQPPSIAGEAGPELFLSRGSVLAGQLQAPGDGGGSGTTTINVHQTVVIGEFVSPTQMRQAMAQTRDAAEKGAIAGMMKMQRAGDRRMRVAGF